MPVRGDVRQVDFGVTQKMRPVLVLSACQGLIMTRKLALHYRLADEARKPYIESREVKVGQLAREPAKPASDTGPLF